MSEKTIISSAMRATQSNRRAFDPVPALRRFFLYSYFLVLVLMAGFPGSSAFQSLYASLFTVAAVITYAAIYLLPAGILTIILSRFLARSFPVLIAAVAVLSVSFVLLALVVDWRLYHLYGFHFNGFVWNLLTTPGGLESMGDSTSTTFSVVMISLAVAFAVACVYWLARVRVASDRKLCKPLPVWIVILFLLAVSVAERLGYAASRASAYTPVLVASEAIPLYSRTSIRDLEKYIGAGHKKGGNEAQISGQLNYPSKPLDIQPPARLPNIVWLVAESLRADMLTPEIMPRTWEFSRTSARFDRHYSGGNGTRMGMFSMFYGLYPPYWFTVLEQRRPPVLMDVLRQLNYQFGLYTSARFTYPEFDKTIFSGFPAELLHEYIGVEGWVRDRHNIGELLKFIEQRSTERPFLTFLFMESPHARYYFPPESVIRPDYLEDFNYVTMDLEKDIEKIRNRYINSVHHLDSQIGRVIDYLQSKGLLNNTIVLITGDHGEEFMEHGHWGHNSTFSEPQVRVPLVLRIPGRTPQVFSTVTSHLDIPATLLPELGVHNPPQDYSQGRNLFSGGRTWTVVGDWNRVAYIGPKGKAILPVQGPDMFGAEYFSADDRDLSGVDAAAVRTAIQPGILEIFQGLAQFRRRSGS